MYKLLSAVFLIGSSVASLADIIEVKMLNKNDAGDRMVFTQELIRAEVGDVIRFLPTDRYHNAQSVKGGLPDGQQSLKGKRNKDVEYTITKSGLTAVICAPHQTMGMVALIVVGGDLSNAQEVLGARLRGKGNARIKALIEEAKATQS